MAFIQCDFVSRAVRMRMSMNVILPDPIGLTTNQPKPAVVRHPTLYLLHGLSEDHTSWQRFTGIERYAEKAGLAVVMPAVHRSFYADGVHGYKYWAFISEELPAVAQALFPLSSSREDTFVAGASMGGYGALKLALTFPERYAAAASLAGVVDLYRILTREGDDHQSDVRIVFENPEHIPGSDNDLLHLSDRVAASRCPVPLLYLACGTEDPTYRVNVSFRSYLESLGLDVLYEESRGGHTWDWWDQQIAKVIDWLPVRQREHRP